MRKDDPSSSRRPRRRKLAVPPAEAAVETTQAGGHKHGTRRVRTLPFVAAALDFDFGLALCLGPALRTRRLPDA